MAEETLVGGTLTEPMISAGEFLIRHLDKVRFLVDAAFWMRSPDSDVWRLVIASPEVRSAGPRKTYRRLQSYLNRLEAKDLSLANITLVDSKDRLLQLLRTAIKTGPGISGIRFTGNTINGVRFPDSFIYRVS
jgi:hypothetical protein